MREQLGRVGHSTLLGLGNVPSIELARELVARIQAVLRRTRQPGTDRRRRFGRLAIDFHRQQAWLDKDRIALTTNEFAALALLVRHAGKVVSREVLAEEGLGRALTAYDRRIETHMAQIRRKIGKHRDGGERIKTVRGAGYLYRGTGP